MKKLKMILYGLYMLLFILIFILVFSIVNLNNKEKKEYTDDNIKYEVFKVGYLSISDSLIIDDYDDFVKYFNNNSNSRYDSNGNIVYKSTGEIINKYDRKYFNKKSLGVIYVSVPGGNDTVIVNNISIINDVLSINYYVKDNSYTEDMSGYYIVVEINKDVKRINNGY